jgi:membrane-associated phospholipid phosphatase
MINYFKKMIETEKGKKIITPQLIIIIIYFIIILTSECFYRDELFEYSYKNFIPKFQSITDKYILLKTYFKISSTLGKNIFIFLFNLIICIIYYSYQEIFICLSTIFTSVSLMGYLKLIYHSHRPYWHNLYIFNDSNELGYGNPSGHSFTSTSGYLSFIFLVLNIDFFKKKYCLIDFLNYGIFIINLLWIFSIMISRLYFAVHSINQIIFGFLLGIGVFLFYFNYLNLYNYSSEEFFNFIDDNKLYVIPLIVIYFFSVFIPFNLIKEPSNDIKNLINEISTVKKPEYKKFNSEAITGEITILLILGAYLGLIFLKKKIEDTPLTYEADLILGKNNNNIKIKIIRFLLCVSFGLPFLLFYIPNYNNNLILIYICKIGIPYVLSTFFIFGPGIYYSYMWTSDNIDNRSPSLIERNIISEEKKN